MSCSLRGAPEIRPDRRFVQLYPFDVENSAGAGDEGFPAATFEPETTCQPMTAARCSGTQYAVPDVEARRRCRRDGCRNDTEFVRR